MYIFIVSHSRVKMLLKYVYIYVDMGISVDNADLMSDVTSKCIQILILSNNYSKFILSINKIIILLIIRDIFIISSIDFLWIGRFSFKLDMLRWYNIQSFTFSACITFIIFQTAVQFQVLCPPTLLFGQRQLLKGWAHDMVLFLGPTFHHWIRCQFITS